MSKDKQTTVINNIAHMNCNIELDKLGEIITDSILEANKKKECPKQKKSISFWKSIWNIIWNKESDENDSVEITAMFLRYIFNVLFVLGMFIGIVFLGSAINLFVNNISLYSCLPLALGICLAIVAFCLAILMRAYANSIKKEKDRNYIVSAFSGVIGLGAFALAMIEFIK